MLLVEETRSERLVGSTNEWVLDNYYMISEQEKVLKNELRGVERGKWKVEGKRVEMLWGLLEGYLKKCHHQIDKALMFRYLAQVQQRQKDYLAYPEVTALLPLVKTILISELADLCRTLRDTKAYHYKPTDKSQADMAHLDEAARQNLQMMNIFNSLKKMTKLPMAELIDAVSFSERMLKGEKAGMYDQMQDKTKEDYRAMVVRSVRKHEGRKAKVSEYEFVKQLVAKADEKGEHVGWQLFPPKAWNARAHGYIWIVTLTSFALALTFAVGGTWGHGLGWLTAVLTVLLWVPMSQVVIDLFNWLLGKLHKPRGTFKLKFKEGLIPDEYATMVIMPTILKNRAKTEELLEQLEVYYLSNINRGEGRDSFNNASGQNLYYTLIGDAAAYKEADAPWDDEVVEAGLAKVRELNEKYGAPIFNFVYRRRAWSEGERTWLGHERKRGAILHFNDLLLGQTSDEERAKRFRCETVSAWREGTVPNIQFIITLDTDTELVLYSAQKLIGAMAHPLNRARLSADGRRVDGGYGIMQPRVNVDVEVTNKSRYAQLFAGLGGLDVYTTASFELYQDIFNEGSFCGKGIYDLRVFQLVLKGAFPQNLILSHDLLEGCHIRCGLINDVELFDDNPSNYIDDAKRHHRWTRGDWQIISWLTPHVRNERGERVKNQVNTIGRWKIFDNLRRSVLSLALMVMLIVGFSGLTNIHPAWFLLVALVAVASPIVFFIVGQLTKLPRFGKRYRYYMTLMRGMRVMVYRSLVQFALLPKEAWMYTDAAVRACWRMWVSHHDLLAWITSDEAAKSTKGTLDDYFKKFWFNYVASAILVALVVFFSLGTTALVAALFCAVTWCGAPLLMYRLGRKFPQDKKHLTEKETEEVRQLAKDTWHFFDSLITEENNWLIPDNYQLNREQKTDYKTSPTNIGYSLTAVVSAAELGFISHKEAVTRLEHIVDTVMRLEKWNGHLYNWYGVSTLKALPNFFISTCDSGNFVACLYAVKGYLCNLNDETVVNGLEAKVQRLIDQTDFRKLYNPELDVFSIGYDTTNYTLLPYHYNNFASEARLTSFLTIAQGDAPYKHWFCLDKTLVQYKGYKGVASWYGTMFEYFMPLIFLPTFKHTLMDETYSFAIRAQRAFMRNAGEESMPWGISETAYNELDDAQNYKYHAFGVPYLKFQNTTPDRIVLSPYSSLMAIGVDDRAVYDNMQRFKSLGMYDEYGFYESYDDEDHVPVKAHYAHHQGMILASLANYLGDHCLQRFFMQEPAMRSMDTLLKEKAQVKPYIDLKVTQYKRYQYSKVQTESDARDFDGIANVPELGIISNGQYTVLMNDRGSGFSRYKNIMLNRYRKISADHYGTYLYIRNLRDDHLWCNTYAPLDVMPESYHVSFASDKISYLRVDNGIETKTEVTVLKDRSAELRRITFTNNSGQDVDLEITTYGEVLLAPADEDQNHRVFAGMKVLSEYDAEHEALLFNRSGANGSRSYMLHSLWVDEGDSLVEYETSRLKFLGRGNSLRHADIIESRRTLTGTVGTTLDPVMSMRRRMHIVSGKSAEAYILTGYAKAREHLLQLTEQYHSSADIEHAFKTASVFNNMRNSLSLLKGSQMRLYSSMAKYMAQTATLGNDRNALLAQNTLSQSGLWRFGISGDMAILLMEIGSMEHSGHAKEMLRAFEYYKVHGMRLDLVFINDAPEREREGLTHFINGMANTEHLWAEHSAAGRVYVLNGSDVTDAERILLRMVARLTFTTTDGITIAQQLRRLEVANQHYQDKIEYPVLKPRKEFRVWSDLRYYNQYGGFDNDGRDYVVTNTNTPMPWVNVIANEHHFGCVVSSTMAGFTFAHNAQQFKLTGWSNDIVRDNASEMLLINRKQFVPATARHSQGWSAFDADYDTLSVAVRVFVACDKSEKYYQIRVVNKDAEPQEVQLDMVYKLVLGISEEQTARYLHSEWDEATNSLCVRNVYHPIYHDQVVRLTATEPLTDVSLNYPNRKRLGLTLNVPAQGQKVLAFVISADSMNDAAANVAVPSLESINQEFDRVVAYWDGRLSAIQVETPDPAFNYMLNRWYLYQVYTSRLFARAGFYQVGGATGFRDQLQDVMSVLYSDPAYARRQILDHAAHQFAEGDVLHWWHESLHLGARTTFSDDYLWLVFVTYQYVHVTGDTSILVEQVPFCISDQLLAGENERCLNYCSSHETASLYEHLRRSVNRAMSRRGVHGLPLMGCGDWNDGMSAVGIEGKGESVWVAFFLADLLPKMEQLTQMMPDADLAYCEELSAYRRQLVDAVQHSAWDGAWFLRAYYDNGDPMGSRNNTECQIDLISQAWSILTDVATPEQKASVFRETDNRLVNREHEIIQLLTPAFKDSQPSPGYIMNYPVGVRENGGQYTHGAMWYIMAQLKEGRLDIAYYLYSLINPIHRTQTLADVLKYKVEPYCMAADIYSNPQHPGRGGWTWYTGSASWAYKTGVENILGISKQGDTVVVDPHVPSEWPSFTVRYRYGNSLYVIHYERNAAHNAPLATFSLVDDGQTHEINI
jgi:cyclic beta-1,2-glucan synthetase